MFIVVDCTPTYTPPITIKYDTTNNVRLTTYVCGSDISGESRIVHGDVGRRGLRIVAGGVVCARVCACVRVCARVCARVRAYRPAAGPRPPGLSSEMRTLRVPYELSTDVHSHLTCCTYLHPQTHAYTHVLTCTSTHTHVLTCTHSDTCSCMYSHTNIHTLIHSGTYS